jgi:hypothetical protein
MPTPTPINPAGQLSIAIDPDRQRDLPEGRLMFIEERLRNRIFYCGILLFVFLVTVLTAFGIGEEHQKRVGPHGKECTDGTYRQPGAPGGAAVCTNGYWFWLAPETFPADKLEDKKP